VNIDGYNVFRTDRPNIRSHNTRGGGVIVYVKSNYITEEIPHVLLLLLLRFYCQTDSTNIMLIFNQGQSQSYNI